MGQKLNLRFEVLKVRSESSGVETYAPETDLVAVFVGTLEITTELLAAYRSIRELSRPQSAWIRRCARDHTSSCGLGELSSTTAGCHIGG